MNILIIKAGPITDLNKFHLDKIKAYAKDARISVTNESAKNFAGYLKETGVLITPGFLPSNLTSAPNLKWIHLTSAGVDSLPQNLVDSPVLITNSSGVHPIQIAEHVLGFMLMFTRGIDKYFRNQISRKGWIRDTGFVPDELYGKTITIVGMGRIGTRIAQLVQAFGMKVYGIVRHPNRKEKFVSKMAGKGELDKLLRESDFVVDCLPATSETKGLFNLRRFKKFKRGSFFMNIGRGDTVVEKDLFFALKNGFIAGAGLDVFDTEPLPDSSALWKLENVIITPHVSGSSPQYTNRVVDIFCQNLICFLKGQKLPNLVDKKLGY